MDENNVSDSATPRLCAFTSRLTVYHVSSPRRLLYLVSGTIIYEPFALHSGYIYMWYIETHLQDYSEKRKCHNHVGVSSHGCKKERKEVIFCVGLESEKLTPRGGRCRRWRLTAAESEIDQKRWELIDLYTPSVGEKSSPYTEGLFI